MALPKTLFLLPLSLFLLMVLANTVHSQADVTSFQYDSFSRASDGLIYERDASVPSGSNYLRLIPADGKNSPRTSSVGRVLYSHPVKFWDKGGQASFESTITFRVIKGNTDPADGMTFFIVPVNSTLPTNGEGSNLGIFNAVVAGSNIFAVEFDPFYSWEAEDPYDSHIGIDINSKVSKKTTNFKMIGENVTVCIKYDAPTGSITVDATSGGKTASVSYVYRLMDLLPEQVQVGLSASTGDKVAFFDVFAWRFTSRVVRPQLDVTTFKINAFKPGSDGLKYERDAFVPPRSKSLRLVSTDVNGFPAAKSVGRVLRPSPVKLWEDGRQASFHAIIKFLVTPIDFDPANGLTFFIVPVNSTKTTGGEGGNLGIFDAVTAGSPIFAVEFDVNVNGKDPDYCHIGIDINSPVSKNVTYFEDAIEEIVTARIDYNGATGWITAFAIYGSLNSTVTYKHDLKTLLPQQVQIGLSASTGPNAAIFDVFSWSFTSIMVTDNNGKKAVA